MSMLLHRHGVATVLFNPVHASSITSAAINVTGSGGTTYRLILNNVLEASGDVSVDAAGLITVNTSGLYLVTVNVLHGGLNGSHDDFRTYVTLGGSQMAHINYARNSAGFHGLGYGSIYSLNSGATGEVVVEVTGSTNVVDYDQIANGWIELRMRRIA